MCLRLLAASTLMSVYVTSSGCLYVPSIRKHLNTVQHSLEQIESAADGDEGFVGATDVVLGLLNAMQTPAVNAGETVKADEETASLDD
jgi:hypothetical protein